jgi:hypothetical protein
MKQVASNKLGLLLKNILQNTQTLQLLRKLIKTEIIYKVVRCLAGKLGS